VKLKDLKIGTQLKIGFGIILLLIAVLSIISWQMNNRLAQQSTEMYEHPLMVSRALGELNVDIMAMRLEFRNFLLAKDVKGRQTAILNSDIYQSNAEKQFAKLNENYLGPATDIENAKNAFERWVMIRKENRETGRNGKIDEAMSRLEATGDIGKEREEMLVKIKIIDDFALNKGDQFYQNSIELKKSLNSLLGFLVVAILLLTLIVIYVLDGNIRRPLEELTSVSHRFINGETTVRSNYASRNEFGILSNSINNLANTVETEYELNDKVSAIAGIMLSEDEAHRFCHTLLNSLLAHTASQMGALYLLNEEKTEFNHFECIGMNDTGCKPFSSVHFEGEFGVALASKKLQHITNIPEDTRFTFSTVNGKFIPREIITIPIVTGNETIAVISLATIKSFSENSLRLLNTILSTLSARLDGILSSRKIVVFSKQLKSQNSELETQSRELAKASSYTRSLIEASVDPLVTIDPDGQIMDVNKATELVTGRSRQELISTDFSGYFTEPAKAEAVYQQVFREGSVLNYELAIQHAQGDITPVLYNASVYRDETGKVIGVFAAARDITERKIAEKELNNRSEILAAANIELESQKRELSTQTSELTEQNIELEMQKKQLDEANKLKTSFLSNMSHELRTPLNSVIALSGVLSRRLTGKIADEEYSYLDVIERNGKLLLSLINDILDLSRIESGHEDIEINRFNVNGLIREVVDLIEPQSIQKNIGLRYRAEDDLPNLKSDYEKCRHILQNIIANAVKFTEEGRVEITTRVNGETIHIAVSDTGIGISSEYLPYIFDEFRQADNSNSKKYGGTGLGMAIAKKYAELLGGSIAVESILGKGSKFTLSLPLHFAVLNTNVEILEIDHRKHKQITGKHTGHINTKDKTILLVEDTEAVITQMKDMLEPLGYNIITAHNGSEALEQIAQNIPNGMILDLMMPGVDGFEVLKRIREEEKTDHLPVIILTAKYVTKEELAFLKHNSIHQLIQKGNINRGQLLDAVGQMMFPKTKELKSPVKTSVRKPVSGVPLVLVVEDNPDNMLTIKAMLQGKCEIIEAIDGLGGIEMAHKYQPHLILMDIALPGMNGITTLSEIRKESSLKNTPVVAVSASAMKGDREDFIAQGFDEYISKPIDSKLFEKVLKEWIG